MGGRERGSISRLWVSVNGSHGLTMCKSSSLCQCDWVIGPRLGARLFWFPQNELMLQETGIPHAES